MRKILALFITLLMLISIGQTAMAAPFADTAGESCENAVEVLSSLGIVSGKSATAYEPASTLTRAEMATILLRAMHMEKEGGGKTVFEDVPEDHWACANIETAYQLGVIRGISETQFAPDSAVLYEQAVKMIIASLGYTVQAEAQGGYPSGYLAKAAQLDILKGVSKEKEMTRGNMAILLYNALDVPMFLQKSYGPDSHDYGVSEKDTLLSYYLKVDKVTSFVSATTMANIIDPVRSLLSDEVAISDGQIFKKGETNVQDMLGIRADFYVKKESDDYPGVVLSVIPQNSISVLDVNAKDVDSETTASEFVYFEDGKEKETEVAGATLVWNGRVKNNWNALDLQPKTGTVRVIKNGGTAEYIIVEAFENYVVDAVVPDTMEVFFMPSADPTATKEKVVIDPTDRYTVLVDEIGEPIPIEGCARWDVVSVAESEDGTVKKIIRCFNEVKGTVVEIGTDVVKIDDKEYPKSEPLAVGTLTLGQKAAYYLDFTGVVTAVNTKIDVSSKYAWLVGAAPKKGLDGGAQFKLYTAEGEMKIFDASHRITLDEIIFTDSTILNGTNNLFKDGKLYPQLVKYKTNEEGTVVTEIDTAENKTLESFTDAERTNGEFSMGFYLGQGRKSMEFNGTRSGGAVTGSTQYRLDNIIFAKVRVNENMPIFNIPDDITRDDLYEIESFSDYTWDVYNQTKHLAVYDISEDYDAGACVIHNYLEYVDEESGGGTGGGGGGPVVIPSFDSYPQYLRGKVGMITGISTTLSEKGEPVRTLRIFNWLGGEEIVRVPEEFECLYRAANADFLADPDWYNIKGEPRDESLLPSTSCNIPTSSYFGYKFRPRRMRLDNKDLMPGDVIQYSVANGTIAMCSVLLRGKYPGNVEMAASHTANELSKGNIDVTSETNFYTGSLLQMYATVIKTTENGPVLSVNLADVAGQPIGKTVSRAIPTTGRFILWDAEKQKMRTITPGEIRIGDSLFSIWKTNKQMMVIVYR